MIFFLLVYNKIDKKQNFSAHGIVESRNKEMRLLSYGAKYSRMDQVKFVEGSL